jgi:hypothetical protein
MNDIQECLNLKDEQLGLVPEKLAEVALHTKQDLITYKIIEPAFQKGLSKDQVRELVMKNLKEHIAHKKRLKGHAEVMLEDALLKTSQTRVTQQMSRLSELASAVDREVSRYFYYGLDGMLTLQMLLMSPVYFLAGMAYGTFTNITGIDPDVREMDVIPFPIRYRLRWTFFYHREGEEQSITQRADEYAHATVRVRCWLVYRECVWTGRYVEFGQGGIFLQGKAAMDRLFYEGARRPQVLHLIRQARNGVAPYAEVLRAIV